MVVAIFGPTASGKTAVAAMARARVATALDEPGAAIEILEHGLEHLSTVEHPCLRAAMHLELARIRTQDDRAGANLKATQGAWPRTVAFLREHLK